MEDYDLIQVLWVEDDPGVTETYPQKAEFFGLELVPFPCWDDAKNMIDGQLSFLTLNANSIGIVQIVRLFFFVKH